MPPFLDDASGAPPVPGAPVSAPSSPYGGSQASLPIPGAAHGLSAQAASQAGSRAAGGPAAEPGAQVERTVVGEKAHQARDAAVKLLEGEDGSGDRVVWLRVAALLGLVLLLVATPLGRWLGLTGRR